MLLAMGLTLVVTTVSLNQARGQEEVFRFAPVIEIPSFDPHQIAGRSDLVQIRNLYEPLVDLDPRTLASVPVLATSWTVSQDALTYVFDLRRNVRFSDGEPFNAHAAKASFDRHIKMGLGVRIAVSRIKEVTAVDDSKLEIRLTEPFEPFLRGLWLVWMVSPKAVRENDKGDLARGWFANNSAGTGPYRLIDWKPGERYILERNPLYWGGWNKPHFSRIEVLTIKEAATQRLLLERGQVDLALSVPLSAYSALARNRNINLIRKNTLEFTYVLLQYPAGPTANRLIRQAIASAVDSAVFEKLSAGTVVPSRSLIPEELLGGRAPDLGAAYDPEKARRLLSQSGSPKLTLQLAYNVPDPRKDLLAEILQQQLNKVGIDLRIRTDAFAALRRDLVRYAQTGDPTYRIDMLTLNLSTIIGSGAEFMWGMFHSQARAGAGLNLMNYSNPHVDVLIDRSLRETDPSVYLPLLRDVIRIVQNDYPTIVYGRTIEFLPFRSNIKGYVPRAILPHYIYFYDLSRAK
jgi:peptide/nickel transport system substrate-binding protein